MVKSWKLREFTLTGSVLSYAEKGAEKGSYTIDSASTVRLSDDVDEYSNLFILKTRKGELVMSAVDSGTRTAWMEVITEVIRGGPLIDIPDVIAGKFYATIALQISFPSGAFANNGTMLTSSQVRRAPVVAFKSPPGKLYTLLMIDPDAPSRAEPLYREFVHWVVVNMPGCDITAGEVVAPYFGAAPPYKSGLHRYYFFLYEQPTPLSPTEVSNLLDYFVRRGGFTIMRWASKMGYGLPVGVEGFHSQWDEQVDELHNEMRFMPPPQYRSPAQVKAMSEYSALEQQAKRQQELATAKARGAEYCTALQLCPDLYPIEEKPHLTPPVFLQVSYSKRGVDSSSSNNSHSVFTGAVLSCVDTTSVPRIEYQQEHISMERFYTLILTDPDAPFQCEFVHWAVVNIPGNDVSSGTPLMSYFPPSPAYGSGTHRFIFLLFEQHEKLSPGSVVASREYFMPRGGLSTASWVSSFISAPGEFNPPVGVNGFTSAWEDICDSIHASMNFMPPSEVRSPSQLSGKIVLQRMDLGNSSAAVSEEVMFFMNSFPRIFNGDLVTKSSDKDVYAKKRWVSINPYTRRLHWAKSEATASNSKSMSLERCSEISLTAPNNTGHGVLRVVSSAGEVVILEVSKQANSN